MAYRTNTCGEINESFTGKKVRLAGWIASKRDHGGLVFIDLRDHYGITQCTLSEGHEHFSRLERLRIESVISVEGEIVGRSPETVNPNLPSGRVELEISSLDVLSEAEILPILVQGDEVFPEDLRLKYRYIDLRRKKLHDTIMLRSHVIREMRDYLWSQGFVELQTPVLTASSPEGARDFLVPSRQFPGKFYALPQAPQQFKQLAMVAGFDKYFQVAPCFRDEDTRSDRVLEFYQLDMEMSFAAQEDVLAVVKGLFEDIFSKFGGGRRMDWRTIAYADAMEVYGSDKPDLRNPLVVCDLTSAFAGSGFAVFAKDIAENGAIVKAVKAPASADRPRSWFDSLNGWARENGAAGLGYIQFASDGSAKGPIAKNLDSSRIDAVRKGSGALPGDSVFFVCAKPAAARKFAGVVRAKLGSDLDLIDRGVFKFAFIVDFPLYELD
ncbi:MAG: aspartate--tRNA ligase, partial [Rickettsiales bacterium]|nr:aspartate--tRNA ligase [Rickettsiales bacterium]